MKRITIAAIALGTALVMFGCSAGGGAPQQTQGARSQTEAATRAYGRVVSIVGNQVVLLIGKPSTASSLASGSSMRGTGQRPSGTNGQMPSGANGSSGSGSARSGSYGGSGSKSGAYSGSGRSGSSTSGNGSSTSGNSTSGKSGASTGGSGSLTGTQSSASADLVYGVATASYLLPAGMKIGTGDFTSVAKNNVVMITMDAQGTITSVSILSTK